GRLYDSFQQRQRFLSRISKGFLRLGVNWVYIVPDRPNRQSLGVVQITPKARYFPARWDRDAPFLDELVHVLLAVAPVPLDTEDFVMRITLRRCRSARRAQIVPLEMTPLFISLRVVRVDICLIERKVL